MAEIAQVSTTHNHIVAQSVDYFNSGTERRLRNDFAAVFLYKNQGGKHGKWTEPGRLDG